MGTAGRLSARRPGDPRGGAGSGNLTFGPADIGLITDGLVRLGFDADGPLLARFSAYLEELALWNRRIDLVRFVDFRELIVRHVLDSLAVAPALNDLCAGDLPPLKTCRLCDVGSGAGFPGIPIAFCFPLSRVVLLERSARRASFLKAVCALVRRPGMEVCEQDLNTVGERFELVTMRALSPFDDAVVDSLSAIVAPDGALLVYQGRNDSTGRTRERLKRKFNRVSDVALAVPYLDAERRLLIARGPV